MQRIITRLSVVALALMPAVSSAQDLGEFNTFFKNILDLVNNTLIPLVFAVALLMFFWGVFKYFILGGGDEGKREEGRGLMLWAIIAFVVMFSIYGIISILQGAFGIDKDNDALPIPNSPTRSTR